jgi:predicted DNA-binding transcriptional regulator AlpA
MSRDPHPAHRLSDDAWLVDSRVACQLIGIGARSLWSLTNSGAIPCRRIGRCVRYAPAELRLWVDMGCPVEAGAGKAIRKEGRR